MPFMILLFFIFGFKNAWCSVVVVAIGYSFRKIANHKVNFYDNFSKTTPISKVNRENQKCAWLNLLVTKYWTSCIPTFVKPQITKLNNKMQEAKPKWMVRKPKII